MKETNHDIIILLENIRTNNDQKSLEKLFKLFYERLLRFCVHYVKDKESAEEIVTNVFMNLWMKRKYLSSIQNPETYLFIAVKNQSLNYLKQFSNCRVVYPADEKCHHWVKIEDPEKKLEKKELIFKLNQAIDTLPRQCKIILNLLKDVGLKYKEVVQILSISSQSVEIQLVWVMKKLEKALTPYIDSNSKSTKDKQKIFHHLNSFIIFIILFLSCK